MMSITRLSDSESFLFSGSVASLKPSPPASAARPLFTRDRDSSGDSCGVPSGDPFKCLGGIGASGGKAQLRAMGEAELCAIGEAHLMDAPLLYAHPCGIT